MGSDAKRAPGGAGGSGSKKGSDGPAGPRKKARRNPKDPQVSESEGSEEDNVVEPTEHPSEGTPRGARGPAEESAGKEKLAGESPNVAEMRAMVFGFFNDFQRQAKEVAQAAVERAEERARAAELKANAAQEQFKKEQRVARHKLVVAEADLQKDGNKAQFEMLQGELESHEELKEALESQGASQNIKRAINSILEQRAGQVLERQKLVRAADAFGWDVAVGKLGKSPYLTEDELKALTKAKEEKDRLRGRAKEAELDRRRRAVADRRRAEAPWTPRGAQPGASSRPMSGPGACFTCGQTGHKAAHCPNPKKI